MKHQALFLKVKRIKMSYAAILLGSLRVTINDQRK